MKLYYSAGACSLSPHIVLRELGNKFEIEAVDLGTKKTKSGKDYTKINPKGYVPALELENGEVLTEGPAIVQYLADKANSDILPKAGTMERYRAMEMLNYITSELHKSMGACSTRISRRKRRKPRSTRFPSASTTSTQYSASTPMYWATSSASPTPMPLPFSAGANGSVSTSQSGST
jgi:glutathione S-transferase